MYPNSLDYAIGCLEAAAGIGLCFGPIIGVGILELGGYTVPFLTFAILFLSYCLVVNTLIPNTVEYEEESKIDTSEYSYFEMLGNKRILFANLAIIVNIFQYTFIDPILTDRMMKDFGYQESATGILFFFLGLGYAGTCQCVFKTLQFISFRRCFFIFFVVNGLATMFYGPCE